MIFFFCIDVNKGLPLTLVLGIKRKIDTLSSYFFHLQAIEFMECVYVFCASLIPSTSYKCPCCF